MANEILRDVQSKGEPLPRSNKWTMWVNAPNISWVEFVITQKTALEAQAEFPHLSLAHTFEATSDAEAKEISTKLATKIFLARQDAKEQPDGQ